MWIFLRDGFTSIRQVNDHAVMLRFRRRDHADRFAARLGIDEHEIAESDHTDYRYRFVASRQAVGRLLADEIVRVDYDNFKSACGLGDYHDALSAIWQKHWQLQAQEEAGYADSD